MSPAAGLRRRVGGQGIEDPTLGKPPKPYGLDDLLRRKLEIDHAPGRTPGSVTSSR
jgi:hypothetical protein